MNELAFAEESLPAGRFAGREDFRQLVRGALACAATQGWSELVFSDPDFSDWPLGERVVIDALNRWARSGRKLTLLARSYDEMVRRHPRFVQWRVTWDHILVCRRSPAADAADIPSVLWSPSWVLHRMDVERCVGVVGAESERRVLMRERLDEWFLRKSSPGFPATTLGL
jgi:hypothetical protein